MDGQGTVGSALTAGLLVTALMLGMVSLLEAPPSGAELDIRLRQGSAGLVVPPGAPDADNPATVEMAGEPERGAPTPPASG
jgi:hypothetical protein